MIEAVDVAAQTGGLCDPTMSFGDYMRNFAFIKAVTCTYAGTAGLLLTGLLVYGAVGLSIYIRTSSIVIPTVLLLLTGGAVLSQVAAPGVQIATILILVSGGGAVAYLYYRYSR